MFLEDLDIAHAPGMPRGLTLKGLPPGLVMLLGPNASGKSTTGRVVGYMLWPDHAADEHTAHGSWRLTAGGPIVTAALKYGRTDWDQTDPLPRTELATTWNLTLKELLQEGHSTDASIANAIQRELNGGYDLGSIDPGRHASRPHWQIKNPLRDANSTLRSLTSTMAELAERESELPELETRAAEAANAPERQRQVRDAIDLQSLVEDMSKTEQAIETLPAHLSRIPDDAAATASKLLENVQSWTDEQDQRNQALDEATAKQRELTFPEATPSEAVVKDWTVRAKQLVEDERTQRQRAQDALQAQEVVQELGGQVWSTEDTDTMPPREALETLDTEVEQVQALRAQLKGLPHCDDEAQPPLSSQQRESLEEARQRLRDWLKLPRPMAVTAPPQRRTSLALLLGSLGLLIVLGAGVVGFLLSTVAGALLASVGLGMLGVAAGLWIGSKPGVVEVADDSAVQDIQNRYAATGHPAPEDWSVNPVGATLDKLTRALQADDRSREAAAAAKRASQRRSQLQTELQTAEEALTSRLSQLGLNSDLGGLPLLVQAKRIVDLAEARVTLKSAQALAEDASEALNADHAKLQAELTVLALNELPDLDIVASLPTAVASIDKRREALVLQTERQEQATDERDKAETRLKEATKALQQHLKQCGVRQDQLDQLTALEQQRAQWKQLNDDLKGLVQQKKRLEDSVPEDLKHGDVDLKSEEARLGLLAEQLEDTQAQIAEIRQQIEDRTQGRSVQDALAEKERALESLAEHRDEQQRQAVKHALVKWLRDERSTEDAPDLLKRAREWFINFTHKRYVLEVSSQGLFQALDTHTKQRQSLSELSDGTRVQLLLAARIAFIEHTEQGGPPIPLFLDEALSTTDPKRFKEIARAVLTLAQTRQIFYATSSPTEVSNWQAVAQAEQFDPPHVARLGEARDDSTWDPAPAIPEPPSPIPQPEDGDPLKYAARLGLNRPGLHTEVGAWPLALVLFDDLSAVHTAAEQGLKHIGQLELRKSGIRLPLDERTLEMASIRAEVISAAMDALRIGRGRPVPWSAVTSLPGFSSTTKYAKEIQNRHESFGHDPRQFLSATRSVGRFGSTEKQLQLEQHLQDQGLYDPSEPLDEAEVIRQTNIHSRTALDSDRLTLADVERLVRFCVDIVQVQPAPSSDSSS